jgi:hypothetical protein
MTYGFSDEHPKSVLGPNLRFSSFSSAYALVSLPDELDSAPAHP